MVRAFLATSAVVLVIFLCALGYSSVAMGVHLPSHGAMIHYEAGQKLRMVLRHTPPFDHLGVHEVAPGKYQAVVIARVWDFTPDQIDDWPRRESAKRCGTEFMLRMAIRTWRSS